LLKNGLKGNGQQNETDSNTTGRLATIGQISAGIAHEVRNPLTAVKGFIQLLQEQHPHKYLDIANVELDRAIATLQNLLQVAKPDLDSEPQISINLCAELESILYLFQDQIYDVDVHKNFHNVNEMIYGKKNQLKKAFFNLIKNAFEAIQGKGRLTIEHYRKDNFVYVCIHDTGMGIPEEKMQLIGTPFFTTKEEGTGMGLTQVYSTIYQHGAVIDVESSVGIGTSFMIKFPIEEIQQTGVIDLELQYEKGQGFYDFYLLNQNSFNEFIASEAQNAFEEMDETQLNNLLAVLQNLVGLLNGNRQHELVALAKEFGKSGAKKDFPLTYKLELIQAFRKAYWIFLYNFHKNVDLDKDSVFKLEREINTRLDLFFNHYFASYSQHKDELLRSHREMIEDLAVPIVPLSNNIAVLPIVGTMDTFRARRIQERALMQLAPLKVKRIVMDLSGVAFMDTAVVGHLFRIIDGIGLMGCKATVTGIRPEIANTMIELGIGLNDRVETRGSLQDALEEYGL
jgi:anti-anti-sigma regulatory factor/mRNA-degrading endonuclease YafQ of YafQ-DinJ toxin-antitoxin module